MEKRWTKTCLLLLVMAFVASPATAKKKAQGPAVNPGTYTTGNEDFHTRFWKETFKGRTPGATGNVLMVVGQGFMFKQAVLAEVLPAESGSGNCTRDWETTYEGGVLVLNSSGPWLNKGKLNATSIIVTNCSYSVAKDGVLDFEITFSGKFDNAELYFDVIANYSAVPEIKYFAGSPVFQRGSYLDMKITISE
jgi:hypothetical protein